MIKLRPGRLAGGALVVLWASLLTAHLWRSYAPSASAAAVDLSAPASAGLTQRGVFYRGVRIGYVREKLTPLEEGFRADQEARLSLNVLGRQRQLEIAGQAEVGGGGQLKEFSFRLSTASGRTPFQTVVRGRVEGGELALTIRSGSGERSERRRLSEPVVLPLNLYHALARQELEVGKSFRLRLLDPLTLSEGDAEIRILDREVVHWAGRQEETFRLSMRFAGLETTAWLNQQGEVLKEETPLGWTLMKEVPGTGLQARGAGAAPDLLAASAIPGIGFAGEAGALSRVRLRLNNFPSGWSGIDGGRQKASGDEVFINEIVIVKESLPPSRTGKLSDQELQSALASDAFIQADDPAIRARAARLTEGLPPLEAARGLSVWVHENVRKTPTLSVPSAREVLEQMAGDCNEHTVLFTALARAAGIPTRICAGLAWSAGQFYYHAWPEVWLGSWLAVDPTFGQFPADPLHLRLLTGGLDRQFEVLKLMGRGATIEILEAR